jgi:hypothetical protein
MNAGDAARVRGLQQRARNIRQFRSEQRLLVTERYETIRRLRALLQVCSGKVTESKVGELLWIKDFDEQKLLAKNFPIDEFVPVGIPKIHLKPDPPSGGLLVEPSVDEVEALLRSGVDLGPSEDVDLQSWLDRREYEVDLCRYVVTKTAADQALLEERQIWRLRILLKWINGRASMSQLCSIFGVDHLRLDRIFEAELACGLGDGRVIDHGDGV